MVNLQENAIPAGKKKISLKGLSMLWIFIGVIILGLLISPTFPKPNNISNILMDASIYGLLALGQTLVMLVKEIDLSVGASMAFSPTCAIFIVSRFMPIMEGGNYVMGGVPFIVLLTFVIALAIGLLNSVIIVKFNVPALITTLGVSYALQGLTYMFFNGYSLYLTRLEGFNALGTTSFGFFPLAFILFVAATIVLWILMSFTAFGNRIYSVGGNIKAARYSGINTSKWKTIAFMLSGFFVAVAALVYCSRMESIETVQGSGYELTTIAIAVIGGTTLEGGRGKITNTFFASILLSMILNLMSLCGLTSWYQTLVTGAIIIGAAIQHVYQYRKMDNIQAA